jgi:diguanylate cyclase (GGDEF)-like protein
MAADNDTAESRVITPNGLEDPHTNGKVIGVIGARNVPVLVVDDNLGKRLGIKAVLAPLGYSIVEADSGLAALRCVMAQNFAVILLDINMPITDGFETAALIRQRDQSEMTPIIFITSHSPESVQADLYVEGAVDFIFAPVPPAELRAKVAVFANHFLKAEELAQQAREVNHQRIELQRLNRELTTIARRDALTGLGNRRALQEDLELLEARVARYAHRYCMALFDIDFFKSYNDTYGHQAGDEALCGVAAVLAEQARTGDAVYRFGGEEFLCIFPEQSVETGHTVVERMRIGVEQLAIPHTTNPLGVLTISAGLAMLEAGGTKSASDLLHDTDAALYRAKQLGRNRVEQVS